MLTTPFLRASLFAGLQPDPFVLTEEYLDLCERFNDSATLDTVQHHVKYFFERERRGTMSATVEQMVLLRLTLRPSTDCRKRGPASSRSAYRAVARMRRFVTLFENCRHPWPASTTVEISSASSAFSGCELRSGRTEGALGAQKPTLNDAVASEARLLPS